MREPREENFTGVKFNEATWNYEFWIRGKLAEIVQKEVYIQNWSDVHKSWLMKYKTIITARALNEIGERHMAKGTPERNGSGRGVRGNRGRGGCKTTRKTGKGRK